MQPPVGRLLHARGLDPDRRCEQDVERQRHGDVRGVGAKPFVEQHRRSNGYAEKLARQIFELNPYARITVFPDVANLPLRPPAVMAKTAATL